MYRTELHRIFSGMVEISSQTIDLTFVFPLKKCSRGNSLEGIISRKLPRRPSLIILAFHCSKDRNADGRVNGAFTSSFLILCTSVSYNPGDYDIAVPFRRGKSTSRNLACPTSYPRMYWTDLRQIAYCNS